MASEMETLCRKLGVKCTAYYGKNSKPAGWKHAAHSYKVVLRYKGRQLTTDFHTGAAWGREPDAADVLSCIVSDARSVEHGATFEEWASDLGYDTDSREAEATYKACVAMAKRARRLLGEDFGLFADAY